MLLRPYNLMTAARRENASVLIIVMWICIGMVSIALYFANSMSYELTAADNRVNGLNKIRVDIGQIGERISADPVQI